MSQPEWKLLTSSDHFAIYTDTTGVYDPEIEVADEYFDGEPKWLIHRWPLERLKWATDDESNRYLVPCKYDASWPHPVHMYQEWFVEDLASVASSAGQSLAELQDALTSDNPMTLASVYMDIAGHHGADNFDSYPRTLTESEFETHTDKNW